MDRLLRLGLAIAVAAACVLAASAPLRLARAVNSSQATRRLLTTNRKQKATRDQPSRFQYYRVARGFLPEQFNTSGFAVGTGFGTVNPWGTYTAYLMLTNGKGQRTWRIENYLQSGGFTQGSTMYLLEGTERALLIDTAQDTPEVMGKNDLKTVARYLLAHDNDGREKGNAIDFVVSNTHSHGDHTGKNHQMSDRTVYYPDLDWPGSAPANYVPIREGGGQTPHGSGMAVGEIALGGRTIRAVNLYGHTPGSMGYLDTENNLIVTGDAIGSGLVWMHFGMISQYVQTLRHLRDVLRPMNDPAVLPAHFYQIKIDTRAKPPVNGRPLDKQYVADQLAVAEGVVMGSIVGEPYRIVGRQVVVGKVSSAEMTYRPDMIETGGAGGYRAVSIPGSGASRQASPIDNIKSNFILIRDGSNNSLYLIKGSTRALLVGTGSGSPGLARFVARLAGRVPVDVAILSADAGQVGGLQQFPTAKAYIPRGSGITLGAHQTAMEIGRGDVILMTDASNGPLAIEVAPLSGHSRTGLTLLDMSDRILLSGDALGTQAADGGLILHDNLASFSEALRAWRAQTDGRYDIVYTAHNYQWLTIPGFVDQLQSAVTRGILGGDAAFTDSKAVPGRKVIRSSGPPDTIASIVLGDVTRAGD